MLLKNNPIILFVGMIVLLIQMLDNFCTDASPLEFGGPIHCISCTTLNANRLLQEVHDENWRHWLENIRFTPNSEQCADPFQIVDAIRKGATNQPCENGLCLKMWFRESKSDVGQVWRSCIPHANDKLRSDCTRISSSQGEMEVCTCVGHLCNGAFFSQRMSWVFMMMLFILGILIHHKLLE